MIHNEAPTGTWYRYGIKAPWILTKKPTDFDPGRSTSGQLVEAKSRIYRAISFKFKSLHIR